MIKRLRTPYSSSWWFRDRMGCRRYSTNSSWETEGYRKWYTKCRFSTQKLRERWARSWWSWRTRRWDASARTSILSAWWALAETLYPKGTQSYPSNKEHQSLEKIFTRIYIQGVVVLRLIAFRSDRSYFMNFRVIGLIKVVPASKVRSDWSYKSQIRKNDLLQKLVL